MKHRLTSLLVLAVLWSLTARSNPIILNEIMYHAFPAVPEDDGQEWLELCNQGTNAVSLNGWKFTKGISYTFTNVSIPAGGYLVVSANRAKFLTQYPGVTNVVGDWVGVLSNNGDEIQLSDQDGQVQDDVAYASQGDWGIRQRGPSDLSHFGWEWFTDADGLGKSLELINSELPNKYGQNWTASLTANGTPGRVNSVIASDIAPLILEAKHFPAVPLSTDSVSISAMVLDELSTGVTVTLFYRLDVNPQSIPFSSTNMFDDGAHGDGIAGDNFFAAILPPRPNNTVVEFYIQATDATGHTRTWPAPARQVYSTSPQNVGTFAQTANLLYQVDDNSYTGGQPVYHLVMTELERAELAQIWSSAATSDAAMNGTFVSTDGLASEVRYTASYRNRGHGSRTSTPHNFRIEFPNDRRWHSVRNLNLNTQNTHAQVLGSALFQKTGLPMANSRPVQMRVNNSNLATPGPGPAGNGAYQFGSYAHNEELASEFAGGHFPTDSGGNIYRGIRSDSGAGYASLNYLGESKESYRGVYFKQNNLSEDDWSDLIGLTRAFTTNDANFVSSVKEVLDVDGAMLYFAVNTLTDNNETALSNGNGDDYAMYRGATDRRFRLLPYDTDSIFGLEGGVITASIFRMTNAAALGSTCVSGCGPANSSSLYRMMTNAEFVPIYYRQLKRLIDTSFSSAQLGPLMDRALAGYVPQGIIDGYKSWSASRNAYVLSQIPLYLTNTTSLATSSGYFVSPGSTVSLNGLANVIETRSVRVNGALANWAPIGGAWSISNVSLNPGINRVLVQASGTNGFEVARITIDIWYDDASVVNVSGTLSSDTVWTAAAGPYNVTSTLTIPAGVTLTIAPGTSVYFASGAGLTVNGKLLASGNETNHIRFARVPGGANWGSLDFLNSTVESRLSYVDFDSCAGTTIGGHNAQVHVNNAIVFIDHCTWPSTPVVEFISFDASSFIVQNCVFPSYPAPTGPESLHGINGIPTGGYGIFRDKGDEFHHRRGRPGAVVDKDDGIVDMHLGIVPADRRARARVEIDVGKTALDGAVEEVEAAPVARDGRVFADVDVVRFGALGKNLSRAVDRDGDAGCHVNCRARFDGQGHAIGNGEVRRDGVRPARRGPHQVVGPGVIPDVLGRTRKFDVV